MFAEMDREAANAALERGQPPLTVARKLAARRLARSHGRDAVRKAVMLEIIEESRSA